MINRLLFLVSFSPAFLIKPMLQAIQWLPTFNIWLIPADFRSDTESSSSLAAASPNTILGKRNDPATR